MPGAALPPVPVLFRIQRAAPEAAGERICETLLIPKVNVAVVAELITVPEPVKISAKMCYAGQVQCAVIASPVPLTGTPA